MATFKVGDRVRKRGTKAKGFVLSHNETSVRIQWDLNPNYPSNMNPETLIKLRKPRSVRVTLSKLKEAWDGYTKHAYTKHDKSDMFAHLATYLGLTDL